MAYVSLTFGGMVQGFALNDPGVRFASSVGFATPFRLVAVLSALALLLASNIFAHLFFRTMLAVLEETKPLPEAVTV